MTTVDALKALYVVLGGSAEAVENITLIPDMINAYENLPSLTAVGIDSNERTVINNSAGVVVQSSDQVTVNGNGVTVGSTDGGSVNVNSVDDIDLTAVGDIYIKIGSGDTMTLEDYIKQVAGIS